LRQRGPQRTREYLRVLDESGFEFIVVGGVAATLHGSTLNTIDVDVVAPFTVENLALLFEALAGHNPHHASRLDLPGIEEPIETLTGWRLLMLETDLGRLDVLRDMEPIGRFADCEYVTRVVEGIELRVLVRAQLLKVKRHVARPKDLMVAEELMAIADLEE
jgi:hypothetical protein